MTVQELIDCLQQCPDMNEEVFIDVSSAPITIEKLDRLLHCTRDLIPEELALTPKNCYLMVDSYLDDDRDDDEIAPVIPVDEVTAGR